MDLSCHLICHDPPRFFFYLCLFLQITVVGCLLNSSERTWRVSGGLMEFLKCENCNVSSNSPLSWAGRSCDTSFYGGACRVLDFPEVSFSSPPLFFLISLLLEIIKGFIVREYSLKFTIILLNNKSKSRLFSQKHSDELNAFWLT